MSIHSALENYEPAARIADKGAILILGATFLNWLPHIAALLTVLWMMFRLLNEYHTWKHRNDPKYGRRSGD
jgi:hypothetical protein